MRYLYPYRPHRLSQSSHCFLIGPLRTIVPVGVRVLVVPAQSLFTDRTIDDDNNDHCLAKTQKMYSLCA